MGEVRPLPGPLEPFLELTVRVPLGAFYAEEAADETHVDILAWLNDEGLGVITDEIGKSAATCLRVRTADGIDRVYPLRERKVVSSDAGE
jgi:hypothetical protein